MKTQLMRDASHLLSDPGGEVVRQYLDEIERLQKVVDERQPSEAVVPLNDLLGATNCACCGKEISANSVCLGSGEHSICMGCEGAEIDVWKVECNGNWYVEKNFATVAEMLEDIKLDEPYTISKLKMLFAQYISLPEFQGF